MSGSAWSAAPNRAPTGARRAVILVIGVEPVCPVSGPVSELERFEWADDAREIEVPFPPPRGAATRLVRYVLAGGDRAVRVGTDSRGVERLYGNLRTAVHRIARDRLTVRRDGDSSRSCACRRAARRRVLGDVVHREHRVGRR
jgi:hypothetical protein